MINLSYLGYQVYPIESPPDFYRSGVPGAVALEKLVGLIRRVFVLSDKEVVVNSIGPHSEGFRVDVYHKKFPTGYFYWIPSEKIFDVYDMDSASSGYPLMGWRGKVLKVENYNKLFQLSHVERLFAPLLAVI